MSRLTREQVVQAAQAEYRSVRGKVVLISSAKVGDDKDHEDESFDPPIRVRVRDTADEWISGEWMGDWLDTLLMAEALDPLPQGKHICWIYGTSRHVNGLVEPGSIVAVETPLPYELK